MLGARQCVHRVMMGETNLTHRERSSLRGQGKSREHSAWQSCLSLPPTAVWMPQEPPRAPRSYLTWFCFVLISVQQTMVGIQENSRIWRDCQKLSVFPGDETSACCFYPRACPDRPLTKPEHTCGRPVKPKLRLSHQPTQTRKQFCGRTRLLSHCQQELSHTQRLLPTRECAQIP